MKRRNLLVLLLAAAFLLCACSQKANQAAASYPDSRSEMGKWFSDACKVEIPSRTVEHGEDYVIQWEDPAMEAHVRFVLDKPEGDILHSDVWNIQVLVLRANQPDGFDVALEQPTSGDTFTFEMVETDSEVRHSYNGTAFQNLSTLSDLKHFDSLQYFSYSSSTPYNDLTDFSGLESCKGLKVLSIAGAKPATLAPLAGLTELERLTLSNCGTLDLTPLEGLPELSVLGLYRANELDSLEPLTTLPKLRVLRIGGGTTYPSLEPLTRTHIEFLDMMLAVGEEKTCKGMDYEPLTRMPYLQYLDLTNHLDLTADLCKRIAAGSPNLRGLDISYTPAAEHSSELQDLGIEWLQDGTNRGLTELWRRLLYKLS